MHLVLDCLPFHSMRIELMLSWYTTVSLIKNHVPQGTFSSTKPGAMYRTPQPFHFQWNSELPIFASSTC